MKKLNLWIVVFLLVGALIGCGDTETEAGGDMAQAGTNESVMVIPVTASSDEARAAFMEGLYAADMGRALDAREHFEAAIEASPDFALGYLFRANVANSLMEFTSDLEKAEGAAAGASEAEQLLIEMNRRGFENDFEGVLATAQELTGRVPESPRAWLALANAQATLNEHAASRQSMAKAIELAPNLAVAHMQLGNSYLFSEPRDLALAATHMQHAIALAPEEPNPYDLLGDVYRAQGKLEMARDAYTEASKYSGEDGLPLQQRAHVNSFLGDYEAARADYQASIDMARGNQGPSYGVYKALVNVHAGEPVAAIEELKALVSEIDGMDIPEPTGLKLFALNNAMQIARHHEMLEEAQELLAEWSALMQQQAAQVGTDQFRRGQEAAIAYHEAMLTARKGEFDTAMAKADEIATLVEPDANPRKMEPVHEVQGMVALEQGNFEEAAAHFRQGDHANDIYVKYLLARSLEGAGQSEEALELYGEVANWNFNSVGAALTRKEAMGRVGA